jgi:diguanylate cyclase (GGDEF)-like protein
MEREIQYLAYYDALTGLPNRALFEDRLGQALLSAKPGQQLVAMMFLNLDRLKIVNEIQGHATGDSLLREVACRLMGCVREGDTVARFGGDEFSLLLRNIDATEDAAAIAGKVRESLRAPFNHGGHELFTSASIGIVLYPADGAEPQTLLKNASAALYRARQQGGDNYQFYSAGLHEMTVKRHALENKLRRALERGEFTVYYQPQVRADNRRIVGMEALIRWQNPDLGLISPAEFIPLAEDTGLIVPIGEWVLRTACAQTKAWHDAGHTSLQVSVNISPRQFEEPNLVDRVAVILAGTGLPPSHLELELTESSVMKNTAGATVKLRQLKERGIKVAIDDFGSGYSSLGYLKHLPINTLKIDQSLVRDIASDTRDAAIIMAVITLAHNLKLEVKAEGVETEEQFRFLRLLGCDELQGYLFSRPLTAQAFEQFLTEDRGVGELAAARLPA